MNLKIEFSPSYYFRRPLQGDAGMGEWVLENSFRVKNGEKCVANCATYEAAEEVIFKYMEDCKEVSEKYPKVIIA